MFCLGLLASFSDLWIPVDAILIILGIFDLVLYSEDLSYPSQDGIQLGVLYGFWAKEKFPSLMYCDLPIWLYACVN